MKLYRLLGIVMYLLNRNKVTAKELAEHFEVSVRTIYRDLEAINQAGIPIVSYQGSEGGYGIIDNYKISKQVLTTEEMSSILVALKGLDNTLNDREIKDIREKIKTLIPDLKDDVQTKGKKYFIDFTPWGVNGRQKEKIDLLEAAIDNNKLITFAYTNLKGIKTTRTVEPMTLVLRGTAWYLYGYCRLREDYRFFKLYRIKELERLEKEFIRKDNEFDESWLQENRDNKGDIIEIVMRFQPEVGPRVEEWFVEEQITREDDGSLLVEVSYPEDEWVYGFILSFGDKVEVLKPDYLREIIKERGEKISDIY